MWGIIYGFIYRTLMKLAHRFDWHYAPVIGPLLPDGTYQRWCKWCGFRESFYKYPNFINVGKVTKWFRIVDTVFDRETGFSLFSSEKEAQDFLNSMPSNLAKQYAVREEDEI